MEAQGRHLRISFVVLMLGLWFCTCVWAILVDVWPARSTMLISSAGCPKGSNELLGLDR